MSSLQAFRRVVAQAGDGPAVSGHGSVKAPPGGPRGRPTGPQQPGGGQAERLTERVIGKELLDQIKAAESRARAFIAIQKERTQVVYNITMVVGRDGSVHARGFQVYICWPEQQKHEYIDRQLLADVVTGQAARAMFGSKSVDPESMRCLVFTMEVERDSTVVWMENNGFPFLSSEQRGVQMYESLPKLFEAVGKREERLPRIRSLLEPLARLVERLDLRNGASVQQEMQPSFL